MTASRRLIFSTPRTLTPEETAIPSLALSPVPPGCAYTVAFADRNRRVIRLDSHIGRLFDSARRLDYTHSWTPESIRGALSRSIDRGAHSGTRFRISILRDGALIVDIEPFEGVSNALKSEGVTCALATGSARTDPLTKSSDWLRGREQLNRGLTSIHETLLTGTSGEILEGASSNFYAVLSDSPRTVRTASTGILEGITRSIVLSLCTVPIGRNELPVTVDDLHRVSEAFITSSTRGIIPIRCIQVPNRADRALTTSVELKTNGFVVKMLQRRYEQWVTDNAESV